jgi:hypothetical protein
VPQRRRRHHEELHQSCTVAADCATTSAAYDADNYACDSGLCHYVGCKNDAECKSSFAKSNYACR